MQHHPAPYLLGVTLLPERVSSFDVHPFSVPSVRALDVSFTSCVTFLVGENGSGKSTVLEGIAALCRLPITGGGRSDIAGRADLEHEAAPLASALRPRFRRRPRDAYFFRGEYSAQFATLLDQRKADPDFTGNPYRYYGGRSLHTRSHGEGYLTLMNERIGDSGLYLLDEPEAALSPQRQLALMALIAARVQGGSTQFIIATHSPILMTIPGAEILLLNGASIQQVRLEETEHFQITKAVLENPGVFWKHLVNG
jgi:predicted ATPase